MLTSLVAAAFVALWSTGFIVARAIKPYADPNLFLLARFAGTAALFGAVALVSRAPWPARREWPRHLIAARCCRASISARATGPSRKG